MRALQKIKIVGTRLKQGRWASQPIKPVETEAERDILVWRLGREIVHVVYHCDE